MTNDWKIWQLDIPSAFHNGKLDTEVYIEVPKGVTVSHKTKVLKLNKTLFGLRESPRCWNETMNIFCEKAELKRSKYDVCLYTGKDIWLILFVGDILLIGETKNIEKMVTDLKKEFKAKDMGIVKDFLGISIERKKNRLTLSQEKFIDKMLQQYGMLECKTVDTPLN